MKTTTTTKKETKKIRVLAVDDEPDVTFMLKMSLEQDGRYDVRDENRATAAVTAAHAFRPDVILLDVMMPDMDGGDVAARIESDPALRGTPIIFLTAIVTREEHRMEIGTHAGRYPTIPKPCSADDLTAHIEAELAKHRGAPAAG